MAGRVIASHYAEPALRRFVTPASLRAADTPGSDVLATMNVGDLFAVLDCGRGLAWGYTVDEHLVGYVDDDSLA